MRPSLWSSFPSWRASLLHLSLPAWPPGRAVRGSFLQQLLAARRGRFATLRQCRRGLPCLTLLAWQRREHDHRYCAHDHRHRCALFDLLFSMSFEWEATWLKRRSSRHQCLTDCDLKNSAKEDQPPSFKLQTVKEKTPASFTQGRRSCFFHCLLPESRRRHATLKLKLLPAPCQHASLGLSLLPASPHCALFDYRVAFAMWTERYYGTMARRAGRKGCQAWLLEQTERISEAAESADLRPFWSFWSRAQSGMTRAALPEIMPKLFCTEFGHRVKQGDLVSRSRCCDVGCPAEVPTEAVEALVRQLKMGKMAGPDCPQRESSWC